MDAYGQACVTATVVFWMYNRWVPFCCALRYITVILYLYGLASVLSDVLAAYFSNIILSCVCCEGRCLSSNQIFISSKDLARYDELFCSRVRGIFFGIKTRMSPALLVIFWGEGGRRFCRFVRRGRLEGIMAMQQMVLYQVWARGLLV